jgi:hypothetical protein
MHSVEEVLCQDSFSLHEIPNNNDLIVFKDEKEIVHQPEV